MPAPHHFAGGSSVRTGKPVAPQKGDKRIKAGGIGGVERGIIGPLIIIGERAAAVKIFRFHRRQAEKVDQFRRARIVTRYLRVAGAPQRSAITLP